MATAYTASGPPAPPMALAAKREGVKALFVPYENAAEATLARGPAVYGIRNVRQLADALNGLAQISPCPVWEPKPLETELLDFKDVLGQESAKRALEIAAAGSHNMLMVGPPGAGKSMLASRLTSILPPLSAQEALESCIIHSVAGELKDGELNFTRPYRDPHHNASTPALVGGGKKAKPGEISLAHNGVLFLDELPEFNRATLEALRQPLENGQITVSRAEYHHTYLQ